AAADRAVGPLGPARSGPARHVARPRAGPPPPPGPLGPRPGAAGDGPLLVAPGLVVGAPGFAASRGTMLRRLGRLGVARVGQDVRDRPGRDDRLPVRDAPRPAIG